MIYIHIFTIERLFTSTCLQTIDDVIDELVDGERTKNSILVTAEVANNGWTHDCYTYFNAPENPDTDDYAKNAPTYEYDLTSQPLVVHCG